LKGSLLREDVPPLRTVEAILSKNEQIIDGMERGAITPKTAEQMSQCCKMPIQLVRLEMTYLKMLQGFGRKAPVPRSALLRSMIPGLNPEHISPSDGEVVRALVPEVAR
jgi:hypothetical protein